MTYLLKSDSEIHSVIENEKKRQREQLVMIASENYTSSAVLEATGSDYILSSSNVLKQIFPQGSSSAPSEFNP